MYIFFKPCKSKFFIPRQRDGVPFNRAGRAIKKSAIVCVGLAAA
jgi:hypothetical protein